MAIPSSPDSSDSSSPAPVEESRSSVRAHGALTMLAVAAAILLARYMQEVLIPFVLAGLVFYALDPLVDRLQTWRLPRVFGAGLAVALIVAVSAGTVYTLYDDAIAVVEEIPTAARKLRQAWTDSRSNEETPLAKVQDAARELERAAAATAAPEEVPLDVQRVQIVEPPFRASDYVWWSSLGAAGVAGQAALVLFLTYFLLVYDDLFKRKLVENVGATLTRKKITVQILNDIAGQIERFILVQIFTSILVAVVTGATLWAFGLEHPWIWGLIAGILNTVPYFGPLIVTCGLGVVAFVQFENVGTAAAIAASAFLITTVEGYWVTPALLGRVAQMNRIAIFAGLLFWSWLWGIPGMLLAVPMMMVVKAVCDRVDDLRPIGAMLGE